MTKPTDAELNDIYVALECADGFKCSNFINAFAGCAEGEKNCLCFAGALSAYRAGAAARAEAERATRQKAVAAWGEAAFGREQITSIPQRALRLLEEAIEAYQAAGADQAMAHKLVDFVFARPVGQLAQELGGVGVCILALAEAAGLSADETVSSGADHGIVRRVAPPSATVTIHASALKTGIFEAVVKEYSDKIARAVEKHMAPPTYGSRGAYGDIGAQRSDTMYFADLMRQYSNRICEAIHADTPIPQPTEDEVTAFCEIGGRARCGDVLAVRTWCLLAPFIRRHMPGRKRPIGVLKRETP